MIKTLLTITLFIPLIYGCSSGGSSSSGGSTTSTQTVNNTSLIGNWRTNCFPIGSGMSTDQLTTFIDNTTAVQLNTTYSDASCSVVSVISQEDFTYTLGAEVALDNTGGTIASLATATEIDLIRPGAPTIYSIIAVENLVTLYFGNTVNTVDDGTTPEKRASSLSLFVPFIKE